MNITFNPLQESDFPLLLKWLKTAHVKAWWDKDVAWTLPLIKQKYGSYVKGYKIAEDGHKEINSYIIYLEEKPIGYIQSYNAYDFPRKKPLTGLPNSLAAFDIFIGEAEYLGKNIGSLAIKLFLEDFCDKKYEAVLVDPDSKNIAAIKAYEKSGFKKISEDLETREILMVRSLGK